MTTFLQVDGCWITIAYNERGEFITGSELTKNKEDSKRIVTRFLTLKGIDEFSEVDNEMGRDLARRVAEARTEGGSKVRIAHEGLSDFEYRVLDFVRQVPKGYVVSYGDVAAAAGSPHASRAVGSIMANHTLTYVVPCHRVVKSDMRVGGYGGSMKGSSQKEKRLVEEGVKIINGRIMERHRLARGK
jgi:O-6-methylguanine DNA methyltransferase